MTLDTVLITGGAGSIGSAICEKLVTTFGVRNLVVVDKKPDGLAFLESIEALRDTHIRYHAGEASSWDDAEQIVGESWTEFRGIDALVTAAGGHQSLGLSHEPLWEASLDSINLDISANLIGTMAFLRPTLKNMVVRGHGNVVCISSGLGKRGGAGAAAYSAAKGGVNSLVQATAREAGPFGIRVNGIFPGGTEGRWRHETSEFQESIEAVPLRRRTQPLDVANGVAFLVSGESSHVTGTILDVSGGVSLH